LDPKTLRDEYVGWLPCNMKYGDSKLSVDEGNLFIR
jgi:hypothetical protein